MAELDEWQMVVQRFIESWCDESGLSSAERTAILSQSEQRIMSLSDATVGLLMDLHRNHAGASKVILRAVNAVPAQSKLVYDSEKLRSVREDEAAWGRIRSMLAYDINIGGKRLPDSEEPKEAYFETLQLPMAFLEAFQVYRDSAQHLNVLFDAGRSPFDSHVPSHDYDEVAAPAWWLARREVEEREHEARRAARHAEYERQQAEMEREEAEYQARREGEAKRRAANPPAHVAYATGRFDFAHLAQIDANLITDLAKLRAAGDAAETMSRREGWLELFVTSADLAERRTALAHRLQSLLRARGHEITERASELRGSALLPMLRLIVHVRTSEVPATEELVLTSLDDWAVHRTTAAELNALLAKLEGSTHGVS